MIRHELEAFGLDEVIARALADEGATALAGATLWTVRGRARSILMGVRVALNFVQRMIGIAACGGVRAAILRAKARAPLTSRIECEVDSLEQLDEVLSAGADIVLLDDMNDDTVAEAIRRAKGKAITEASGGITLARIPALAQLGVDVISVGALTHSVKAADVGLDFA
jgi:nicotinate-nucleotide pyrophosphorylase